MSQGWTRRISAAEEFRVCADGSTRTPAMAPHGRQPARPTVTVGRDRPREVRVERAPTRRHARDVNRLSWAFVAHLNCTMPSEPALASSLPSGLKATADRPPLEPEPVWRGAPVGSPVSGFHHRSDPPLAHAVVDVEPRVARLLEAILVGMLA